jgi:hypothetical protein
LAEHCWQQQVWTFGFVPKRYGNGQSLIVLIAAPPPEIYQQHGCPRDADH